MQLYLLMNKRKSSLYRDTEKHNDEPIFKCIRKGATKLNQYLGSVHARENYKEIVFSVCVHIAYTSDLLNMSNIRDYLMQTINSTLTFVV